MAVESAVAVENPPALPLAPATETEEAALSEEQRGHRKWVLGLVSVSHTINHMNGNTLPVVFGVMMTSLGLSFTDLGLLQAVNSIVANSLQASYGLIAQYSKRSVILGIGNIVMGLGTMFQGATMNFGQMLGLRVVQGAGSSPQHPVGSTMLVGHFPKARGRALALHSSAGNLGQAIAPILAAALIYAFDWRVAFVVVGIPSILVGIAFLLVRDKVQEAPAAKKGRIGWEAYKACLKNPKLMLVSSLLFVGAGGRDGAVTQVYFVPHFMRDLGIAAAIAASLLTVTQIGGMLGPLGFGWLSDKFSRKMVLQTSLVLSAVSSLWLGQQFALSIFLVANLLLQGASTFSRQTLTQAMIIDYTPDERYHDAAFSLYYTIGLISGPAWSLAIGAIMQNWGFTEATYVMAGSYVVAMGMLLFLRDGPSPAAPAAPAAA